MRHFLLALTIIGCLARSVSAATPTLVQHVSGPGQEGNATKIKQYNLRLPNVVGNNNAVIVGISECIAFDVVNCASAPTPTAVTDDKANSYTLQASIASTNNKLFVYVLCGITNGPQQIQVQYAASQMQPYRTVVVSEYYNVATTTCVDTTNTNAPGTVSSTLATGVFTTPTSGDLIWTFGEVDDTAIAGGSGLGSDTELASWTPQGSYTMLDGNTMQYATTNAFVASGASPCSPTACNVSTYANCSNAGCATEAWSTVTVALKNATAGTAPTTGAIHVDRAYHINIKSAWCASIPASCTAWTMVPRGTGNLVVFAGTGEPTAGKITSVVAGSDTYSRIVYDDNGQVVVNLAYIAQPTSSETNTITWTYTGSVTGGELGMILVVSNAALVPLDKNDQCNGNDSGFASGTGTLSLVNDGIACTIPFVPVQSNELLIGIMATNNNGQGQSVSGASPGAAIIADSCSGGTGTCTTSPELATSPIDENDAVSVAYLSSATGVSPTWTAVQDTTANLGMGIWTDIHVLFEQAPVAVGGRLRTLIGVGR